MADNENQAPGGDPAQIGAPNAAPGDQVDPENIPANQGGLVDVPPNAMGGNPVPAQLQQVQQVIPQGLAKSLLGFPQLR
ncbi:unnamed protein product [Rhizoctonia solani]|uniref:Uncharacterized protein n=1 Tax=Rhizoctonia solani TaxID=456999 RepID=A0A8H2W9N3_9AGAM|nr:unnamed protein product [Rhizoctonia solani]